MNLVPQPIGPARKRSQQKAVERQKTILFYAIVSLISLMIGLAVLGVMLWNAQFLVNFGLTGNYYYVVLLVLGLAAAAFLFGVLQSSATYRGESGWGVLELGGPIVSAVLVVPGGFFLVPNPSPFEVTFLVHEREGFVRKASGDLLVVIGSEVRRNEIGENGAVYLTDIPPTHRGEAISVSIESKEFELIQPEQRYLLKGDRIQVEVRKKSGKIFGRVQDQDGKPLEGVKIEAAGLSTTTASAGRFEFVIPGDRLQPAFELVAEAAGYSPRHYEAIPNANELVVALAPEK